jgi:hypothetical protein
MQPRAVQALAVVLDEQLPVGLDVVNDAVPEPEVGHAPGLELRGQPGELLGERLSIRGEVSTAIVDRVAEIMAAELGWTPERRDREIESFIRDLADYHGVSREMLERRTRHRSIPCA